MSDITANVVVSMPSQLFTLARSFKAASNGKIYIGRIDTDPTIPSNQIQVYVENEDGSLIPVTQPIIINDAGFPVYSGQIAKFMTVEGHSMAVYDAYGTQQFYFPNVLKYSPDQLRMELNTEGQPTIVDDSRVRVLQHFTGAQPRSLDSKNSEYISLMDTAAKGDGVTDDTDALNAVIASFGSSGGEINVPINPDGSQKRFLVDWSRVVNPFGVRFTGEGSIVSSEPVGGLTQRNLYGDTFRISYGQQYLYRIYERFRLGQQAQVFLFGDSTVQGGNGELPEFSTGQLVFEMFSASGLNVNVINRGVAGTSVYQMNAIPDVSNTSDLFVIKYGINDPGTPGTGDRLTNFATALRTKLSEIRNNSGMNTLSIILVGPNSTNDTQHNRDALWYEKLRGIYMQAAKDYKCAYLDTYGYMSDVKGTAGYAMDNPFGNGQGVHPMNTMQCWIWGAFINEFFSGIMTERFRSNLFLNVPSSSGSPSAAQALSSYRKGETWYRATTTNGWPQDGALLMSYQADNIARQTIISFSKSSSKSVSRTWNTAQAKWNSWTGTAIGLTPVNGWQATWVPEVRGSADGLVTISALLASGTTTAGTNMLSGLPADMYPAVEKRFAQANSDGTHACVSVKPTGEIAIVSGVSSAGIHINISYYSN
jgi:lysophospholipase L1-like esterase